MTSPFDVALERYAIRLAEFEAAMPDASLQTVLALLIARDEVEAKLNDRDQDPASGLLKLIHLDSRLREYAQQIAERSDLETWCKSLKPKPEAWWWFFQKPIKTDPRDRFDWVWSGICLATLTASLSLIVDIGSRFLSGGPDILGAFTMTLQSVLALVTAKGTLTESGQAAIQKVLVSLNVPKVYVQETKMAISILFLLGLVGVRLSLPQIATQYIAAGIQEQRNGLFTAALADYNRATKLDPDNAEVHYRMGTVYEDLQEPNSARSAYQIAAKSGFELAYSNLARLYILDNNLAAAVSLLLELEPKAQIDDKIIRAYMLKNLGWARFAQKRYAEALTYLQESVTLFPEQSAHCLVAQVLEVQKNQQAALNAWEQCLAYAEERLPEEDAWIHTARQRLTAQ
jgi:tetratricopeptide (TPR) repeat protein